MPGLWRIYRPNLNAWRLFAIKLKRYLVFSLAAVLIIAGVWLIAAGTTSPAVPRVEVLLYHELQPGGSQEWPVIDPGIFYAQLNALLDHGWQPLTLEQFAAWQQGKLEVKQNSFLLTFDDGGESIYHHAYPFLLENEIPAVIFLIGKYHDPDYEVKEHIWIPKLNERQIGEMAASGIIQFQSHAYDLHHYIDGVPAALALTPAAVREDLKKSISLINALTGQRVFSIAYPAGAVNEEILEIAREAGFELGFSGNIQGPACREEPMTIKRFPLDNISMRVFNRYYGTR